MEMDVLDSSLGEKIRKTQLYMEVAREKEIMYNNKFCL